MAIRSGFHNSVNGDRTYNAEDMNRPYKDLVSNGVFPNPSTQLQVLASSGMTVSVSAGGGLFGNGWAYNDAPVLLTIDSAEQTLNRYDAIVIKRDESEDVRDTILYIKKGTPANTPTAPSMTHDSYVDEYCLALIYVGAKVTQITQAEITDTRPDTSVCGWVTGLIEQVDTSTLFLQWQTAYSQKYDEWDTANADQLDRWNTANADQLEALQNAFNDWWDYARTVLADDESASAELLRLGVEKADRVKLTASLTQNGWTASGEKFTQTVNVNVGADDILLVGPDEQSMTVYMEAGVICTGQTAGQLTFTANEAVAVGVNIVNMGA